MNNWKLIVIFLWEKQNDLKYKFSYMNSMNYLLLRFQVKYTLLNYIRDFLGNYLNRLIYKYFSTIITKREFLTYMVSLFKQGVEWIANGNLKRIKLNFSICFGKKTGYCFIK